MPSALSIGTTPMASPTSAHNSQLSPRPPKPAPRTAGSPAPGLLPFPDGMLFDCIAREHRRHNDLHPGPATAAEHSDQSRC
jgi:hypothetical protein